MLEHSDRPWTVELIDVPSDVIVIFLDFMTIASLARFSATCSRIHHLVEAYGWTRCFRSNPRSSRSLSCVDSIWTPYERLRYNTITDYAWEKHKFIARPLSSPWTGNYLPVMAISNSRLVIAVGRSVQVYGFMTPMSSSNAPGLQIERLQSIDREQMDHGNITGIAFIPDGGRDRTLVTGFEDGSVMKMTLTTEMDEAIGPLHFDGLYQRPDIIESLTSAGGLVLTLSGGGDATLYNPSTRASSELELGSRGWATHLSTSGSLPYAAFGTLGPIPLSIHFIAEAALSEEPQRGRISTAVYGICDAPPSFSSLPGQVLVSGWFDGLVRLFDLRDSRRLSPTSLPPNHPHHQRSRGAGRTTAIPSLAPVMTLYDSLSNEAVYTVASGGGSGYIVAAGSATNSVVAFWDLRNSNSGWSVYAPGNDRSPVQSIIMESSRLFGVTQRRPFVYDFGPGVNKATYPPVPLGGRFNDKLKPSENGVNFYVTTYRHKKPFSF